MRVATERKLALVLFSSFSFASLVHIGVTVSTRKREKGAKRKERVIHVSSLTRAYKMRVKKLSCNIRYFAAIYYVLSLDCVSRYERTSRIREVEKKAIRCKRL